MDFKPLRFAVISFFISILLLFQSHGWHSRFRLRFFLTTKVVFLSGDTHFLLMFCYYSLLLYFVSDTLSKVYNIFTYNIPAYYSVEIMCYSLLSTNVYYFYIKECRWIFIVTGCNLQNQSAYLISARSSASVQGLTVTESSSFGENYLLYLLFYT